MKRIIIFSVAMLLAYSCGAQPQGESSSAENNTYLWKGYTVYKEGTYNPPIIKEEGYWKDKLSDFQYYILREQGTERRYSHEYNDNKRSGYYTSAASGQVLFSSDSKYESYSGWPSFFEAVDKESVVLVEDHSFGFRLEVVDSLTGSHLGHVFTDGPDPTGLRFCMNGAALSFVPEGEPLPELIQ
jgi:peptide-methionine (R)-S-oxide reductase